MSRSLFSTFNLTIEEQTLLEGQAGHDFSNIAAQAMQGSLSLNHLDRARHIANKFFNAGATTLSRSEQIIFNDRGGYISQDSHFDLFGINTTRVPNTGKEQGVYTLNLFRSIGAPNAVSLVSRSTPVFWHFNHIQDRMAERGVSVLDKESSYFVDLSILGLSMTRILEEIVDWNNSRYAPVVLPAREGLLFGTAEKVGAKKEANRLGIIGFNQAATWQFGLYEWLPEVEITMRTFYGLNELTPKQIQLRNRLSGFLKPNIMEALSLELDAFNYLEGFDAYSQDTLRDKYEENFIKLGEVMETPLWHQAAKLSRHHRQANQDFKRFGF